MTDAEYEEQKERVNRLAQTWISALGLRWWRIHMVWVRDQQGPSGTPEMVAAETNVSWQYLEATG